MYPNYNSKTCSKCNREYPNTAEYFYRDKSRKDGLCAQCKTCRREYDRQHWLDPNYRQRSSEWQHNRRNDPNKRDKILARQRRYQRNRLANDPAYLKRQRDLDKQRYIDPIRRVRYRRYQNAWLRAHPDAQRVKNTRRRARVRSLPSNLTKEDFQRALEYFGYCCAYCGDQQGFWNPMSADHFIPLVSSDCPGTTPNNMLPACQSCNSSKNKRDAHDWLIDKFGKRKAGQVLSKIEAYFASLDDHANPSTHRLGTG